MSAIVIYENDGTVSYAIGATPPAAPLAVDFPYFFNNEITVTRLDATGETVLTETRHYVLTGVPADDGFHSGSISMVLSVTNCTIRIDRTLHTDKASNFPETGAISITGMNTLFSRIFSLIQDLRRLHALFMDMFNTKALHVPAGDMVNTQAPLVPDRQGHYASWDSVGNFTVPHKTVSEVEGAVEVVWGGVGVINVGEGLVLPTLGGLQGLTSRPKLVITKGYTTAGDQGGGAWHWNAIDMTAFVTADPLHGLFAPPFTAPTGASGAWQRLFSGAVSPLWFGATGNGTSDDTIPLQRALESGYPVDGGGYSYAVANCTPATLKAFRNATLNWLTPGVGKMLSLVNLSAFALEDLFFDMKSGRAVGTMSSNHGLSISSFPTGSTQNARGFALSRIRVFNGGPQSGIVITDAWSFSVTDCDVRDFTVDMGVGFDPQDDVMQLFWFNRCANFSITGSRARNATCILHDAAYRPPTFTNNPWLGNSRRWSRGFAFGGCSLMTLSGCSSTDLDQGYDLSGSDGNSAFTIGNCNARHMGSFGFKFANSAFEGVVTNCYADDCGSVGFVVSGGTGGSTEPGGHVVPLSRDISFSNCRVYNTASDGKWASLTPGGATSRAFAVWHGGAPFDSWPRGIKFQHCQAIDRQATPTTNFAFQADAELVPTDPTILTSNKDELNEVIGCSAYGIPIFQQGFHFPYCALTGPSTLVISTGLDSVITWPQDIHDTANMHSTGPQFEKVYIKKAGFYDIALNVEYQASGTGSRRIFIKLTGANDPIEATVLGTATDVTRFGLAMTRYLEIGAYVEGWTSQTSGGALSINLARSSLAVNLRR